MYFGNYCYIIGFFRLFTFNVVIVVIEFKLILTIAFFFFSLSFFFNLESRPYLMILKVYFWLCAQRLFLVMLRVTLHLVGDRTGLSCMKGNNLNPCPISCFFSIYPICYFFYFHFGLPSIGISIFMILFIPCCCMLVILFLFNF